MNRVRWAGLLVLGFAAWLTAALPGAAQDRDDRYFTLRDPFRTERSYVPRTNVSPPMMLDAPSRQAGPLDSSTKEPEGDTYASSQEADEERETPALEYIAVLGDALAGPLAQGLADSFVQDMPEVAVIKKARGSSSLIRDDGIDWVKAAEELLGSEKVTVGVVMLGVNERQSAKDETGTFEPRTERWVQIYTRRIDELMAKFKAKNIPLFWVGLPAMKSTRLSQDMQYYNEIIRERAARAGVPFVDVWDGFVDENGQFVTSGPALDGQTRRLRASDGIAFSRAGARKLAHFVERDIRVLLNQRIPETTPPPADDQPAPSAPSGTPSAREQAPQQPPRPVAGPVVPLVGVAGPSGPLAGANPARSGLQASDPAVTQVLLKGEPAPTVAGRADDFVWPAGAAAPAPPVPAEPGKAAR
ncbi:GDSL-type esterase/lipase family protein [Blastochloris viridis]|uniref:Probable periplasmic protein Cj0610c n=1 Tax=Blastochloris viridis TaxID=1079 RepID=A0A0H5BH33_BLAVI|nr:SGNH family hydrolase [Blastochloris viridis]ALK10338.1 hypothetical protein BVIR_2573 [Blastochloris viridis]BAR99726.1 probable periplasmic protein Cj0610c [Blastochloris viridis]CUU43000.1 hypothetical protein BVIRIDIS_20170 [Blastochloris viridis]